MTAEDVETAIIRPMRAAFPAPTHVRTDPAAREELLNVYRRSLERFDRPTLERAWQKAASGQKYWTWPLPEVIAGAAEHFHSLAHPKAKPDDGWVEKATALTDAYTRRFMLTTQAGMVIGDQSRPTSASNPDPPGIRGSSHRAGPSGPHFGLEATTSGRYLPPAG